MKHKVKVTVIDKKVYPELQQEYCAYPDSVLCPCYNVGDEFVFYRDGERDDFWHMGIDTLVHTDGDPDTIAGGPKMALCSELWDAISRYIYAGLQGGSIMKGCVGREYHDCVLLRRHPPANLQDRTDRLRVNVHAAQRG